MLKPEKIITKEIWKTDGAMNVLSHSDKRSLRESAYKCRRKLLPVLPKSYDEAMDQLKNRQTSTLHRGQQFCFVTVSYTHLTLPTIYSV